MSIAGIDARNILDNDIGPLDDFDYSYNQFNGQHFRGNLHNVEVFMKLMQNNDNLSKKQTNFLLDQCVHVISVMRVDLRSKI